MVSVMNVSNVLMYALGNHSLSQAIEIFNTRDQVFVDIEYKQTALRYGIGYIFHKYRTKNLIHDSMLRKLGKDKVKVPMVNIDEICEIATVKWSNTFTLKKKT